MELVVDFFRRWNSLFYLAKNSNISTITVKPSIQYLERINSMICLDCLNAFARLIPKENGVVKRATEENAMRFYHTIHPMSVSFQYLETLSCIQIPFTKGFIIRSTYQVFSLHHKRFGCTCVAFELPDQWSFWIPDIDSPIIMSTAQVIILFFINDLLLQG